ncbi:MAG TPA: hypothetical protein PLP62_05610 [Flavobacteriaceae bacterium]|nr:hypothetical protein [Alteromonas sp.]HPF10907.1 hypothetical protein [Flavobacteriaceae bacterium]HRW44253.1 hypothetical protein [Flavobacteriaceae bacterium]
MDFIVLTFKVLLNEEISFQKGYVKLSLFHEKKGGLKTINTPSENQTLQSFGIKKIGAQ